MYPFNSDPKYCIVCGRRSPTGRFVEIINVINKCCSPFVTVSATRGCLQAAYAERFMKTPTHTASMYKRSRLQYLSNVKKQEPVTLQTVKTFNAAWWALGLNCELLQMLRKYCQRNVISHDDLVRHPCVRVVRRRRVQLGEQETRLQSQSGCVTSLTWIIIMASWCFSKYTTSKSRA